MRPGPTVSSHAGVGVLSQFQPVASHWLASSAPHAWIQALSTDQIDLLGEMALAVNGTALAPVRAP
jgi:hypothetical protein